MGTRYFSRRLLFVAFVALAAPCLWAQDGVKGAFAQAGFTSRFEHSLAVADLDGDNQPDGAVLLKSGWPGDSGIVKIQLHLTNHANSEIAFRSSEAMLSVAAWDIDNDGATDLVVEEALTHKPLHVWINDGKGDFHEGRVQDFPSLTPGTHDHLQSPNQTYCLALSLPLQRGIEVPTLAAGALARPPSTSNWKVIPVVSISSSRVHGLNSSRAPPVS